MLISNTSNARENFYKLLEQAVIIQEPTYITGKQGNVVMILEENDKAMEETIHLLSVKGMKDKLIMSMNTPLNDCLEDNEEI